MRARFEGLADPLGRDVLDVGEAGRGEASRWTPLACRASDRSNSTRSIRLTFRQRSARVWVGFRSSRAARSPVSSLRSMSSGRLVLLGQDGGHVDGQGARAAAAAGGQHGDHPSRRRRTGSVNSDLSRERASSSSASSSSSSR